MTDRRPVMPKNLSPRGRAYYARRYPPARKRRRVLRVVERFVLGAGMAAVAFVLERRLIKAIKEGGFKKKELPQAEPAGASLLTAPEQVHEQGGDQGPSGPA